MGADPLQPLRGMSDIRAPEIYVWQHLEREGRRVLDAYGFEEIRTPALEYASLFRRTIGDTTDVVSKEMYAFQDRGGRDVALRPEGTASVMRAVAAAGQELQDARLYYWGPMFRYERPEAGRRRQLHQLGAEAIGGANPSADAECMALQLHLLSAWGVEGCRLEINTMGLPEDREGVLHGLRAQLRPLMGELCDDCRRRFDLNVLRILDCKNPGCRKVVAGVPALTEWMSETSRDYFHEVRALLELLDIEADLNPRLVRGLDYYAHTVWEIIHPSLGAQDALCGGGRYRFGLDSRVIEGVGFAMGIERVVMTLQALGTAAEDHAPRTQVYVVTQHEAAFRENLMLAQSLRLRGISCGIDLRGRSFRKQMRAADKARAEWVVIRGEQEMNEGTFVLRDMDQGAQESLEMPGLMERLTAALRVR